jgi:hypothetical protein
VRWHRMGFAAYWRWKSRPRGGRPRIGSRGFLHIKRRATKIKGNEKWRASQR